MQALDFLKLVLPEAGHKCWVAIQNKRIQQGFTQSLEELIRTLQMKDAQGMDAYFACASFKQPVNRKSENALACQGLWADGDCGEGKPYADADACLQALDEFADRLGIPLPLCVGSGRGVHAYWPFLQPVTAAEWTSAARTFKRLTESHGLHLDPSRTADVSSILRLPGTHNHKYAEKLPVFVIEGDVQRLALQDYLAIFQAHIPPLSGQLTRDSISSAILNGAKNINCPSMTQGFGDGYRTEALAQRAGWLLARGHNEEETIRLCRAWNQYNTPPKDDDKLVHDIRSYAKREAEKHVSPIKIAAFAENPLFAGRTVPALPAGFGWKGSQLCRIIRDMETGLLDHDPISAYPLFIKHVCRRENETKFAYAMEYWHPSNGVHEFCISARDLHSSRCGEILAENGAPVNATAFKAYIREVDTQMKAEAKDSVQYEQFGWKEDGSFLVGSSLVKPGGETAFAYGDPRIADRMKLLCLAKNADVRRWAPPANKLYSPGYEAHGFALLAGFSAPLMKFACGNTDGGAILNLFSQDSGYGKSKALEAIASIWGKFDAISLAGQDTDNAKFNIISTLCNIPVLEDELARRDPVKACEFMKAFTIGRDKNRSQRDGSVQMRKSRFQTIMISASNRSLYEIVKQGGDQGAIARIFEIAVDFPDKESFKHFQNVANEMALYHGAAGRAFICGLQQPGVLQWAKDRLEFEIQRYIRLLETRPEHRFVVWLLATCHTSAVLLNKMNILNFDVTRLMEWAMAQGQARVNDATAYTAPQIIGLFVNEHIDHCLVMDKPFHPKSPGEVRFMPRGALVARIEQTPGRMYISSDVLRSWLLKRDLHYLDLAKKLEKEGILLNRSCLKVLSAGTNLPPSRVPAWEIDINNPVLNAGLHLVDKAQEEKEQDKLAYITK